MFSRLRFSLLLVLLPLALTSKTPASPPELIEFEWRGDDVILVFSDSVGYQVDLAASDSSQVVVRLRNISIAEKLRQRVAGTEAPTGNLAISLNGRRGRTAALTQRAGGETSLHVHDDARLGYSIVWRPYSRQLVIHTFEWDRLDYGAEQYHQGLIAIEQRAFDQAEEHLQLAGASGENRAHAVLASLYARRGEDSLALYYLRNASTGEEYAALAAIQIRSGDSAAADASRARSERLLVDKHERGRKAQERGDDQGTTTDVQNNDEDRGARNSDIVLLAAIGGLALVLIIGLLVLSARRGRSGGNTPPPPPSPPNAPPPPRRDPTGFRVVDSETSGASSHTPGSGASTSAETTAKPVATDTVRATAPPPASRTAQSSQSTSAQPEPRSRSTWESAAERRSTSHATPDESSRSASARVAGRSEESTVEEARRMGVSRDNVELRRRMSAASTRDKNVPD